MAAYEVAFQTSKPSNFEVQPMSRTMQYRKVMKPMLERKRRARINRCLDELKDLMVSALATEGENASKLEKADILELTVAHLNKLKKQQTLSLPNSETQESKFRDGFTTAAREVSRALASIPGVDIHLGKKLMTHLGQRLSDLEQPTVPLTVSVGPASFESGYSSEPQTYGYSMPMSPPSSRGSPSPVFEQNFEESSNQSSGSASVWRPW